MKPRNTFTRRLASKSRQRQMRLGSAVIEFALLAPIFLLFVFGIIEFGRVMQVKNVITNASREAARAAAFEASTADEVEQIAKDVATVGTVPGVAVQITPANLDSAAHGSQVSVTVSVDFKDVSLLPLPTFLQDLTLSGTTKMQREGVE